jgi:hypothetical protein
MKRTSTLLEVVISTTLFLIGFYLLYEGNLNESSYEGGMLIVGALCFTSGVMMFASAVASLSYHRNMRRRELRRNRWERRRSKRDHATVEEAYSYGAELARVRRFKSPDSR